jgi:CubicO group peptidase (beta-lactamase class C family)
MAPATTPSPDREVELGTPVAAFLPRTAALPLGPAGLFRYSNLGAAVCGQLLALRHAGNFGELLRVTDNGDWQPRAKEFQCRDDPERLP